MSRVNVPVILLSLLLLVESCTREDEMYSPEIVFIEPEAGFVVEMPDTLVVKVKVSDSRAIMSVKLSMVNENKIPVIPVKYYFPDSTAFLLETSLPLTDKYLAGGLYDLLVTVSNGTDQKNKYLPVNVHEIPVQLQGYIAVTGDINIESAIIMFNPDFTPDTQFVYPGGYWLSAIHSRWGKFFFVTDEPSRLIAFNAENFETEWEMVAASPRPLITAIFPDRDLVFATANGDAGILSNDGNVILRTASNENKTIQHLAADHKYIYAAHVSLNGDIHELTVYYRVSGIIRVQVLLAGQIRSLIASGDEALIFLSSAAGIRILKYDPEDFTFSEMSFLPDENLIATEKASDSLLFILTEKKVISYDLSSNQLTDFTADFYVLCRYDPLSDLIFLARDNMVYGFDRFSGDLITEKSFSEEVLDFQILYNK